MIKEDIIAAVSRETGFRPAVVEVVIESMLERISHALANGGKVQFSGFGTFELKKRAARTGRNPHTNQPVPIPERFSSVFKPGKSLKGAADIYNARHGVKS